MLKIRLETSDGQLVTEVEIPPFKMLPGAILWGSRIFVDYGIHTDEGLTPVYREVFCYAVPK